ncbi:MAG: phosphatidate cytidylyltransferase [Spirochaetaceae bacterium]
MTNLQTRLILFVVGIPLLFGLVVLLPQLNHLGFNVFLVTISGLTALEMGRIIRASKLVYETPRPVTFGLGIVLPLVALASVMNVVDWSAVFYAILAVTMLITAAQALRRADTLERSVTSAGTHLIVFLYPGLFLAYVVRLSALPNATILILAFIAAVFFNDASAYAAGLAFGYRRGIVPVSPNKSLVGFIVGLLVSPFVLVMAALIPGSGIPFHPLRLVVLGLVVGLATILGDLLESAFKRAAEVKDSGRVIPGRGGFLDSIDSPIFAAPVFFHVYQLLFL